MLQEKERESFILFNHLEGSEASEIEGEEQKKGKDNSWMSEQEKQARSQDFSRNSPWHEKAEFFNEVFENLGADPIQTQALMGYLLVINGISNVVTFGPGMNVVVDGTDLDNPLLPNPPGGFDYTHNGHRGAQAVCWQQCLSVIDKLIDLLKPRRHAHVF